jgi:short-subunit dehydrogenase
MRKVFSETVLITGASSGIGLELAKCFAAEYFSNNGCRIILVARNRPALESLAEDLRKDCNAQVGVLPADLSLPDASKQIFNELQAANIHVDVLVNNAGFGAIGAFAQLPMARQIEMIQVNVTALTELTRLFLPGMIRCKRGGILNVSSVAGFVPGPGMAVYYATKAFVLSFSEALAAELEGTGVNVTALCPGPTPTNFGNVAGSKNVRLMRAPGTSAEKVARDGHAAFRRGRAIEVPGVQNKFVVFLARLLPRILIRKTVRKFNGFRRF